MISREEKIGREIITVGGLVMAHFIPKNCYTPQNYYLQISDRFLNDTLDNKILKKTERAVELLDQYHWLILKKEAEICTFDNPLFLSELQILSQAYQTDSLEEAYHDYQSKLKELGASYYFKAMLETDAYLYQQETKEFITQHFPLDFLYELKTIAESDEHRLPCEQYDNLFEIGMHEKNVVLTSEEKEKIISLLKPNKQKIAN